MLVRLAVVNVIYGLCSRLGDLSPRRDSGGLLLARQKKKCERLLVVSVLLITEPWVKCKVKCINTRRQECKVSACTNIKWKELGAE